MPTTTNEYFKFLIIIQILFGLFMTGALYFLPDAAESKLTNFQAFWDQQTASEIEAEAAGITDSIQNLNPVLGAMYVTFKSGFIVLDLLINSMLAIPQMISILLSGFFMMVPINPWISATISALVFSIATIVYVWMLITFIFSAVSGRVI